MYCVKGRRQSINSLKRPPVLSRCGARTFQSAAATSECSPALDRKSTRLNSSHSQISYAVFCLKKKKITHIAPLIIPSYLFGSNLLIPGLLLRACRILLEPVFSTDPPVFSALLCGVFVVARLR